MISYHSCGAEESSDIRELIPVGLGMHRLKMEILVQARARVFKDQENEETMRYYIGKRA